MIDWLPYKFCRFVGDHPALAVVPALGLYVFLAAAILIWLLFGFVRGSFDPSVCGLAFVATNVAMYGWVLLVGCIRGRAGQSIEPARDAVLRLWAIVLAAGILAGLVLGGLKGVILAMAVAVAPVAAVGIILGTLIIGFAFGHAQEITRRRIASGQWEATIPPVSAKPPAPPPDGPKEDAP